MHAGARLLTIDTKTARLTMTQRPTDLFRFLVNSGHAGRATDAGPRGCERRPANQPAATVLAGACRPTLQLVACNCANGGAGDASAPTTAVDDLSTADDNAHAEHAGMCIAAWSEHDLRDHRPLTARDRDRRHALARLSTLEQHRRPAPSGGDRRRRHVDEDGRVARRLAGCALSRPSPTLPRDMSSELCCARSSHVEVLALGSEPDLVLFGHQRVLDEQAL
jgi:hypothetical protein